MDMSSPVIDFVEVTFGHGALFYVSIGVRAVGLQPGTYTYHPLLLSQ